MSRVKALLRGHSTEFGELNLRLAQGLPGAENLNVESCLRTLRQWTGRVRASIEEYYPLFEANPARFEHSHFRFWAECLVTTLRRDLGVHYDPTLMTGEYDATDSRPHFIHGPLMGFGGTCSNLPVLYVAVGRRCGLPWKLVQAREHLFVRHVGANGERFNIEATTHGFASHDDDHYKLWPKPLTKFKLNLGTYLKDFSPQRELACFIGQRGRVLQDNFRFAEAIEAYRDATSLDQQYEIPWAIGSFSARIYENLPSSLPDNTKELKELIARVTPNPKEQWERDSYRDAQVDLLRIIQLRAAKKAFIEQHEWTTVSII